MSDRVCDELRYEDLKAIDHASDNSPAGSEFMMFDANKLVRISCDERGRVWKDGKLIYDPTTKPLTVMVDPSLDCFAGLCESAPDLDEPFVVESPK